MTLLFTHPLCAAHDPGPGHPESSARLQALEAALERARIPGLRRREAPEADDATLELAHDRAYCAKAFDLIPAEGIWALDDDTLVSPSSGLAARRAAGAAVAAVDAVLAGEDLNAFAAVRPPGHHAASASSGGFCIFNNVALGARHALRRRGAKRVAILDFDVHHGNGTQALFRDDAAVFFCSLHQEKFWPYTGAAEETGTHGNILNLPLPRGTEDAPFLEAMRTRFLPRFETFAPDLLLVSAGFDGHQADPLGGWSLSTGVFGELAETLVMAVGRVCAGRLVASLEGGYDLEALGASVAAFLRPLADASQTA